MELNLSAWWLRITFIAVSAPPAALPRLLPDAAIVLMSGAASIRPIGAPAGAVFSLALAATAGASHAETPANALIVAQSIDDAVSFDPAEGFELTTVQSFNNLYQRLIESDRNDGPKYSRRSQPPGKPAPTARA
jgi:hypothetical protein